MSDLQIRTEFRQRCFMEICWNFSESGLFLCYFHLRRHLLFFHFSLIHSPLVISFQAGGMFWVRQKYKRSSSFQTSCSQKKGFKIPRLFNPLISVVVEHVVVNIDDYHLFFSQTRKRAIQPVSPPKARRTSKKEKEKLRQTTRKHGDTSQRPILSAIALMKNKLEQTASVIILRNRKLSHPPLLQNLKLELTKRKKNLTLAPRVKQLGKSRWWKQKKRKIVMAELSRKRE